jgi:hypothetical protein
MSNVGHIILKMKGCKYMKEHNIDLFADELGHRPLPTKPKKRRKFEYKDRAFVAYCHGLNGRCCAHNHRTVGAAETCLARHRRLDPKNWGYAKDCEDCGQRENTYRCRGCQHWEENKSTLVEVERCGGENFGTGEEDKQYWEKMAEKKGRGKYV